MKKVIFTVLAVAALTFIGCETETTDETLELNATEKDCGSSPGQKACDDN